MSYDDSIFRIIKRSIALYYCVPPKIPVRHSRAFYRSSTPPIRRGTWQNKQTKNIPSFIIKKREREKEREREREKRMKEKRGRKRKEGVREKW